MLLALTLVLLRCDDGPDGVRAASVLAAQRTPLGTPAAERAVAEGLSYLAGLQAQSGDGSFAITDVERGEYAPLGVTALCTLAFLAAGSEPGRGPHGEVVTRAVEFLVAHTDLGENSSERGYISLQGDVISKTHGHGYATLALAEAYGMAKGSERIRSALVAAVERIEKCQGSEGGWFYTPYQPVDHEGSVTICLVQALRAARDAGIQVNAEVVRRAEDYVRRLQAKSGLFCYTLGDERRTSIGLTAAAVATLNSAGTYDDVVIHSGIDAIWSALGRQEESGKRADFPEYERLYLAQAFWQLADTSHFNRWFPGEREDILKLQEKDGAWRGSRFGSAYVTAVNCLVLSLPDGVLPVFQR
ncbi:MAG: prenyltransferase [Planctomycetes bacterium]|nr:prenyltransferase [Planctomycetota bacterium]